jgi:GAF domain-containing protein
MKLTEFCSSLDARLTSISSDIVRLETIVEVIRQGFKVSQEEVAILLCDEQMETIHFLWPMRLKSAGFIPITSHNSLAVKTLREKQASLNNTFSGAPHASVFEQVRLAPGLPPQPIQKIMSVPLPYQGKIIGVIQVSRKGVSLSSAGEDFTSSQLTALSQIAECVAHFIVQSD